jgi:aminopeptidase YwaD
VARDPLLTPTRAVEATDRRADFLRRLRADDELWRDFQDLCDCGGRLAGSASEARAQDWCAGRLSAAGQGAPVRRDSTPYAGWVCHSASLTHLATGQRLDAIPLLGTARTAGTELDVLDLGRGTPEQIQAAGDRVRGRAVMVAHEYPFATSTVHRRVKLAAAQAAGAAAFLVAQPEAGVGPVSGSSGRGGGPGIPAMGISAEAAEALRGADARVRIEIDAEDLPGARTDVIVLDLPGGSEERVVLSAHIDGHPLAESAIDNGTGVAAVLALARNIAPFVAGLPRGLTVCIFSAEEWALNGSREWLRGLPAAERERIVLNVNLDSLAGSNRLTALTSGFPRLGSFAQAAAGQADTSLAVHLPLMSNSDHANFAAYGIPALRLIAGFDEPASALRLLLSRADTRELVDRHVLQRAAACAGAIVWSGLSASAADLHHLRSRA